MDRQEERAAHTPRGRLIFGREERDDGVSFGFGAKARRPREAGTVGDGGEGHVLAIAPTGAGKGRNVVLPNVLTYPGAVVVIDPKGEAAQVSARRRREMGQQTIVLNPFDRSDASAGAFNPLDILDPASDNFTPDCIGLAATLTGGTRSLHDPFWDLQGERLIAGLIAYIAEYAAPGERHLGKLRAMLCAPELSFELAKLLDGPLRGKTGLAAEEFANFLGHEGEKVRTSVRSTAQLHTMIYAGDKVQQALNRSSFDPALITAGAPLTIYIVVPPHLLQAYGGLLRVWVGTLMTLITRRRAAPERPTLFVLDELAQLGPFPLLKPAVTLLRGYGVRCMMLLQDLAQLRNMFPEDHATIVNNCATVMTFGHTSYAMSCELAGLFGDVSADELFAMPRGRLALRSAGEHTRQIGRLDYLTDEIFAGQFDRAGLAPRGPDAI